MFFYLINNGSCKWRSISIRRLFQTLKFFSLVHRTHGLRTVYVPSAENPADALSLESRHGIIPWSRGLGGEQGSWEVLDDSRTF